MIDARMISILEAQAYGPGVVVREYDRIDDPASRCPVAFLEFTVEAHTTSEPHRHASSEIWRIESGTGRIITEDGALDVGAGSLVYLRPDTTHCLENSGAERMLVLSIYWIDAA